MPQRTERPDRAVTAETLGAEFIEGSGFEGEEPDSVNEQKVESYVDDH